MYKRRLYVAGLILLVLVLAVGCGGAPVDDGNDADGPDNGVDNGVNEPGPVDDDNGNGDNGHADGLPEGYQADAADELPDPWLAYPGSAVDAAWHEPPWNSDYPGWTLVAPGGTTREEVIDYYLEVAEAQGSFEMVETWHGIGGNWLWNGFAVMIETDLWYNDPDYVQIQVFFEEDID
ncbi:MAG: hypothetical protein FH749_04610 [Firmicutes bacterium]|nr:hypothetical protein [Bacillota bacterium]